MNQVYRQNFVGDTPLQVNIESIKLKDLDGAAQIWTMSPPCQPFTTTANSKRLDVADSRNKAFMHLMNALEKISDKPEWIFFENVKGFENSATHAMWIDCLIRAGYSWRQYLLSPFQFRVPNGRTRFYMAIHLNSKGYIPHFTQDKSIVNNSIDPCRCSLAATRLINGRKLDCSLLQIDGSINKVHELGEGDITGPAGVNPVSLFLEDTMSHEKESELLIPDAVLQKKWAEGLSVVGCDDRCTFCFTSAYGQVYQFTAYRIM